MTPPSTFHLGQPPGGLPDASYSIPAAMAAFAAVVGEELAEEILADVATELFVGRIPTRQQPTWVRLRRAPGSPHRQDCWWHCPPRHAQRDGRAGAV